MFYMGKSGCSYMHKIQHPFIKPQTYATRMRIYMVVVVYLIQMTSFLNEECNEMNILIRNLLHSGFPSSSSSFGIALVVVCLKGK